MQHAAGRMCSHMLHTPAHLNFKQGGFRPGFLVYFVQMVHSFNTPANIRLLEMNGIFSGVWIWRLFPFYPQNNEVQGWESKMAGRIKGCGAMFCRAEAAGPLRVSEEGNVNKKVKVSRRAH